MNLEVPKHENLCPGFFQRLRVSFALIFFLYTSKKAWIRTCHAFSNAASNAKNNGISVMGNVLFGAHEEDWAG
jgi:hypothetical protein